MSETVVEIKGDFSLDQIELQIRDKELAFWKFVGSSVGENEGRVTNLASFTRLQIGQVPPEPKLLGADQPPPAGKLKAWAGVILAENKAQSVILYR